MPKIPMPEGYGVAPGALEAPVGSVNPAPLAEVGRGLQSVGAGISGLEQTASNLYAREHEKESVSLATNAETTLQDDINKALSPNDGLMSLRGDQALAASNGVYERLAKRREEIGQGIGDFNAKRLFSMRSKALLEEAYKQGDTWVGHQRLAAQEASAQGIQAVSLQAVANSYATPDAVARYAAQAEGPIQALALSPEDAQAKLTEWRARVASTVLNQFIATKDVKGAQDYFAQAKDTLGPQAAQYEHTINTLKEREEAANTAIGLLNSARKPNGFVDDSAAVQAFESLPPEKRTAEAQEAFHKYLGLEKQAQSNKTTTVFQSAFSNFLGNHSLSDVRPEDQAWLMNNAPEDWHRLERLAVEWNREAAAGRGSGPRSTAAYITLAQDIEQNPLKYKGMPPGEFNTLAVSAGLTEQDWKKVGEKYAAAQKTKDYMLPTTGTVNELFQRALGLSKTKPDTWPKDKQELWRDVHDYVEHQATQFIKDHNGKQPGAEDLEKFANDRLIKGTVVGGGLIFGDASGVSRVEAEHNPRFAGKAFQEAIPDATLKQIVGRLKAKGVASPSDQQIRAVYERLKGAQ
jgi:hypothetical protein